MKRVLIISYYWPPAGGAGVQRWVKHVKYLESFGWKPVIYTPQNPDLSITDWSLLPDLPKNLEVIQRSIWEPYDLYRKLLGKKPDEAVNHGLMNENRAPGILSKMGAWVRGNFFIPDARRFWIKPSIRFLKKYVKNNPVDAIISTGPPQSMHLIALGLKRAIGIPWVADFRDPWTNNDVYHRLPLTYIAENIHHRLERRVLIEANKVVTVSWQWAKEMQAISGREVEVITNGYDKADFPNVAIPMMDGFVLHHVGSMYADRNPMTLWKVLGELCSQNSEFNAALQIRLTGKTDEAVIRSVADFGLQQHIQTFDYQPHDQVVKQMRASTVLLLLLNDAPDVLGRIPGKIFEYLAAERPVLGIGSAIGDSARILKDAGAGQVVDFDDFDTTKEVIVQLFDSWRNGRLLVQNKGLETFSREACAARYGKLLTDLTTVSSKP
jgi:glycosyltransferase involved in cell wall biosynthesis